MNWFEWIAIIIGGLVVLDILFVGAVVAIDIIRDWRLSRENRSGSNGDH